MPIAAAGASRGAAGGRTGLFVLIVILALWPAAASRADSDGNGANAYLEGLDKLAEPNWPAALAAFNKAALADEENADYRTARGVAMAMSGQFPAAIKELQRSLKLRGGDWETKLWLCAAYDMSGDPATGAQYLVHGPPGRGVQDKADLDYSNFVYMMSHNYWDALTHGKHVDSKTNKTMTTADIAAADFPKAAAWFAQRRRGSSPPQLAGVLLDRVKANMQARNCLAALKDLDSLLSSSPMDDSLILMHAEASLAMSDYSASRSDFTRILTDQPTLAAAYLGRAPAAAHMADSARAKSDLAVAAKLGDKDADAVTHAVDRALAATHPQDPNEALAQFQKAAGDGTDANKLDDLAMAVELAVNSRRLRYDEIYQDHIRILDAALRAGPQNPDHLADLADYLFKESDTPFEQVEPRSWPVYYRFVPQAVPKYGMQGELLPAPPPERTAGEVARASKLADDALAANPQHVRSMLIKGEILNYQGQYGQSRDVLDKAIAIKPDDPMLLRERSVSEQAIAREDMLAAEALRNPKITSNDNGNGTVTVTTVYPSAADLARADELEREAKEAHEKAVADMAKAMKLTEGTGINAYWQGLTDYAYHNVQQAQTDYQQAVKLDANLRDAWYQLAKVDMELNQLDGWAAAREGAIGSIQTTAGPWLFVARDAILHTKYKTAREALAAARLIDPADAREYAYLGVIESENDKPEAALADYRMAMALEDARASLRGRTLAQPGGPLPVEPADIGLTLALRNRAAALFFLQGKADEAYRLFGANAAYLSSLPPERLSTPLPQAVLPSSTVSTGITPINETLSGLKLRAQAGLEYTGWARRYSDAADVAAAAQTYNRLVVEFNVTDPKPDVLQAVVNLGLAELEVRKGNFAKAKELLKNEGATPQPLWQEMRKVESQVNDGLRNSRP